MSRFSLQSKFLRSASAGKLGSRCITSRIPKSNRGGADSQAPVTGSRSTKRFTTGMSDDLHDGLSVDIDFNAGPLPWSAGDRRRALAPVTDFLAHLPAAETARWSLVTIVVAKLWFSRGTITAAHFENAGRQLLRQIKNTGLPIGVFVLDTVVRPRIGEKDGPVGLQFHFHGPVRISFPDKRGQEAFRKALGRWARGNRAVKFGQIKDDKGGAHGFTHYGLKDLRNPLKTFGRRIVPTNDGWTRDMRRIVADSGLRPDHLILLHGIRRYGRTVRVLDPDMRREIAAAKSSPVGPARPVRRLLQRVLPNGCLAPVSAPHRVPPVPRQIPFDVTDTDWTPVLPPIPMSVLGHPALTLRLKKPSPELIGRGHVHRHVPPANVGQLADGWRDLP